MPASLSTPAKRPFGRTELVLMMALLMSLQALAIDAMLPALDEIAAEFTMVDANRRQLVVGLFLLASGLGSLLPGPLADRFGRKPMLFFALGIYVTGALACALAPSFDALLVMRVLSGIGCSGLVVLPGAIIRDRFEGDAMARLMSMIAATFMIVPILAPSLGQAVLLFAGWRYIFVALAVMGSLAATWVWVRLPETLNPEYRQKVELRPLLANMKIAATTRASMGYVLASSLVLGTVYGYVNSSQQLIGEHFRAGDAFPLVFGGTAATMALSNIVNSRIVERFGARRVSHTGLFLFIAISAGQVWVSTSRHAGELLWFLPLMAANLALLGFLGANFSSIAMQPFARIAGAASSLQSFLRMVGAAVIGLLIGQAYDGTARPLAIALLVAGLLGLLLVSFSERGKLFRRLNPPHAPRPIAP